MDRGLTVKTVVAIIMSIVLIVLIALIAIALLSDIPVSLRVFAVGASIYGFFEIRKWVKNKSNLLMWQSGGMRRENR